jgi:peptidylprolyl isomerase
LESADLIVGTGTPVEDGDSLEVQYVLASYSSGKDVESSWSGQPIYFTLGSVEVFPGWNEGLIGMRVGGRRELIVPPSLGYGDHPPVTGIAADDALVFVVDLVSVTAGPGFNGTTGNTGTVNTSPPNTGNSGNTGNT